METRIVHDNSGEWYINTAKFVLVDPGTQVRFEANTPIKTVKTAWMASQPTISDFVDETAKPEKPASKVAAKA